MVTSFPFMVSVFFVDFDADSCQVFFREDAASKTLN